MRVLANPSRLKAALDRERLKGRSIGFVPTMGALHEGHLSLVRRAKRENDVVVASIFVNPTQFGPKEDYKRYPRDLGRDRRLLALAGADFLFTPSVAAMYPAGSQTVVKTGALAKPLCGASRPWHFDGVATVVLKLLVMTAPDRLYLGQKDFQQFRVVERMTRDFALPVKVVPCPIVRERDGLAMSSRNTYLTPDERRRAPAIRKALLEAARAAKSGSAGVSVLKKRLRNALESVGARVDYVEIADAVSLEPVVQLKARSTVLFAVAAYFGRTRLIDNLALKV